MPDTDQTRHFPAVPVIILIFVIINLVGLRLYYHDKFAPPLPELTPTILLPSPTSLVINKTTLTIAIQNGSGRNGAAAALAQKFVDAGYATPTTSNASRSDVTTTKLIFKSEKYQQAYSPVITQVLSISPEDISVDISQSTDIVIIIGSDK